MYFWKVFLAMNVHEVLSPGLGRILHVDFVLDGRIMVLGQVGGELMGEFP